MSQIEGLSLRCIAYNNYLVAADQDGFYLENFTTPTKENALWTVTHDSSLWILVNKHSSMRLIFDAKNGVISSSQESESIFKDSLEVKGSAHRLLLRVPPITATAQNQLELELLDTNTPDGRAYTVFFVFERLKQMFHVIDPNIFSSSSVASKTIVELRGNHYDYIVIGSSFCAVAFIQRILLINPKAKILVLEKGLKYLPEHHQHCHPCPPPGAVESRPWAMSHETEQNEFIKDIHGQIPYLGGRSTYWSAWSPTPSPKELAEWPEDLKTPLQETYFPLAHKFLGVTTVNKINTRENNSLLYGAFQTSLKERFDSAISIESIDEVLDASLAMDNDRCIKFSTAEMLLHLENVTVILNCTVEKILHDGRKATALQTSQGPILISNGSKLILAMSTLPATTLVLNSFDDNEFLQLSNVGKRFSAHFISSVIARVPRRNLSLTDNAPDAELGAVYIAGIHRNAQYHLQLSGVAYAQCSDDSHIHNICKKYSANSIPRKCIDTSQDFIVVSCSTLGELDYKNKSNQFYLDNNCQSPTTNGVLNFNLNDQDTQLWDHMDHMTFQVINKLSSSPNSDDVEYWHEASKTWCKEVPPSNQIRKESLVHDTSTMWIGDSEAPVGFDYRLKGVENVYVTGGALWPTGGSWNPVLTIVAMAMHLADTIHENTRGTTTE